MSYIIKFIPFLFAITLCLKHGLEVLSNNLNGGSQEIIDSVQYGVIVLILVGISVLFKRNIWKYLFLLGILLTYTEYASFSNFSMGFSIGPLNINAIPTLLLISHISLNLSDFQTPDLTPNEIEQNNKNTINRYVVKYERKSDSELKRLHEMDLTPEAREALEQIMKIKQL